MSEVHPASVTEQPTSRLPRVLILTARAGGGHLAGAQSLAEALEGKAQVTVLCLMDDHTPFPFSSLSAGYAPTVEYAPWIYRLAYAFAASRERVEITERLALPLVRRPIAAALAEARPDLVISIHGLQTDVPIWILRQIGSRAPFVTVVQDPITAPVAWFSRDADLTVVPSEQARAIGLSCGLDPQRVRVVGMPIRRAFVAAGTLTRQEARARLGLEPERPMVLMTGGGAGIGRIRSLAQVVSQALVGHPANPRLTIIAGRNRVLERQLRAHTWPAETRVLGFVHNVAEWMAASNLLVSKAGPNTIAEACATGLPMIITGYIEGQESGNITWVTGGGAGVFEPDARRTAELVVQWLQPGSKRLTQMSAAARDLARPHAADEIAAASLELLTRRTRP